MKTTADYVREYREYAAMKEELDATLDALRLSIIAGMDGAEELKAGEYTVRYRPVESRRLDTKALREALPDLAARFTVAGVTRRFTVV